MDVTPSANGRLKNTQHFRKSPSEVSVVSLLIVGYVTVYGR